MKNKITALLAILAFLTVSLSAAGYNQTNSTTIGECKVDLSIKIVSSDKDDGQIRYKYKKTSCPKTTKIQLVNIEGGYTYKKKRKNIFFRASNQFDNPQFTFTVSVKNSDGFTETHFLYMSVDVGEELDLCELLGICTNAAQVNLAVIKTFSKDEDEARINITIDRDETVDYIQITNMVFEGDITPYNDDNNLANFPEEVKDSDQWELHTTTFGEKKLISYTYKVYFVNEGNQEEKEPVIVEKVVDLNLGVYTD